MDGLLQWLSSALALLPAGLIAGVGIGAGTEAVKWLKESSQRRREQRDAGNAAALELVPLLTKFARECDSRWCCNEYQERCYYDMPKLPAFPDNLTWTALPQKAAGAIRALPNELDAAESNIKFEEFPDQRYESASRHYILVGNRAAQLADELRHHFGQGRYKSTTEYDFQSNLRHQRRRLYRGRFRRSCDYVRYSRWASRLKRRLRRVGKCISSATGPTGVNR
ncbi:MAG TPA: hypothetical protein VFQ90_02905 [Stellaceae bacterium]|jgi:hypothetical protein|nr:hypothetical protein [Stellaceae bacterium]